MMGATLIYDGECPLCRKAVAWVEARGVGTNLSSMPCQSEERARQFPELEEAECMRAVQIVLDDGTRYAGADALPHILARVRGWRWMALALRLPGVAWCAPFAYDFVAKRRRLFSILVAEKAPRDRTKGQA